MGTRSWKHLLHCATNGLKLHSVPFKSNHRKCFQNKSPNDDTFLSVSCDITITFFSMQPTFECLTCLFGKDYPHHCDLTLMSVVTAPFTFVFALMWRCWIVFTQTCTTCSKRQKLYFSPRPCQHPPPLLFIPSLFLVPCPLQPKGRAFFKMHMPTCVSILMRY